MSRSGSRSQGSSGRRVVVLGGTSEIALECVRALQAQEPREVALLGRDLTALGFSAERLRAGGVSRVVEMHLEALDLESHEGILREAFAQLGGADIVILAVGVLGERGGLPDEMGDAVEVLQVNAVGAGSLLLQAAKGLRDRGGGVLVVLSSVAAERPRRANAVYGASKAALDSVAQAVGDDLHEEGVRVLVVRPGFVRTRMTAGLAPAPMATTPEAVAEVVLKGLQGGADTVWAPSTLRWVMLVMRMVPRRIFRRIKQ
jgi:decaprenylphospho-beta-D-erythro-pentofuranosid-2-ulose 2-reductase